MKKRQIAFVLFMIFSQNVALLAATKVQDWTVACCKFEIVDSSLLSNVEKSGIEIMANQIPALMLGSLPSGLNRTVHPDELLARELYDVQSKQQTQFEAISALINKRDSLIFNNVGVEYTKKIHEFENSKKEAEKTLSEYMKEEKTIVEKYSGKKKVDNELENIAMYKNDNSVLYEPKTDFVSIRDLNSEKIRALITGQIYEVNGYVQVEAKLTLYPENRVIATASEFGSVREVEYISSTLMNVLLPSMINDDLVKAEICISPLDAGKDCTVYIEDEVYHGSVISAAFTKGRHTIRVESPGYDVVFFTLDFDTEDSKMINIELQKQELEQSLFVTEPSKKKSEEAIVSNVYLNTNLMGSTPVVCSVKNAVSLGEVENSKGDSTFFLLKNGMSYTVQNVQESGENVDTVALVKVPEVRENLTKKIDTRRKVMYWSYGGLILTVPVYYFFKGMYDQCTVNSAIVDTSVTSAWKLGQDISMYVMIAAGANFLTQLILYLVTADKVIPKVIETKEIPASEAEKIKAEQDEKLKLQEEKAKAEEEKLEQGQEGKKESDSQKDAQVEGNAQAQDGKGQTDVGKGQTDGGNGEQGALETKKTE